MQLSIDTPSWKDFARKALEAFSDADTRVYIDTSFLMWLTKVGPKSLSQFTAWIETVSGGRFHVPVWACHEYANHHVAGTLNKELEKTLDEISGVADGAYKALRPYLDADLEVGKPVEAQQAQLRATLSGLASMVKHCRGWKSHYKPRAGEVMNFISRYALPSTPVFDLMSAYPALGIARFDGRVPPGFKDRGKREKVSGDDENIAGSNKYGDLIFWQEILKHAKSVAAKRIVILSKDGKNDWIFGGGDAPVDADLQKMRRSWKPLPVPHPMLLVEARDVASVEDVLVIDSPYLGALLRQGAVAGVESLTDVAVVPDPPTPSEQRKEAVRRAMGESATKSHARTLFADGSKVESTPLALKRALIQSLGTPSPESALGDLVQQMHVLVAEGTSIVELLTEANFKDRTTAEIAHFGRAVHGSALSAANAGYHVATADLINALEQLPEKTAGALMLGILAAMYMATRNECRLPATSPVLDQIYKASQRQFARVACEVVSKVVHDAEMQPLFCPTGGAVKVEAKLDIDHDDPEDVSLSSLVVGGEQLLNDPQFASNLNLRALNGGKEQMLGNEILALLSGIFGVPLDALDVGPDGGRSFHISASLGFKDPSSVYVEGKGEEDA